MQHKGVMSGIGLGVIFTLLSTSLCHSPSYTPRVGLDLLVLLGSPEMQELQDLWVLKEIVEFREAR